MRDWMWWFVAPLGFVAVIAGLVLVPIGLVLIVVALNAWVFHIDGIGLSLSGDTSRIVGFTALGVLLAFILGQWYQQWRDQG